MLKSYLAKKAAKKAAAATLKKQLIVVGVMGATALIRTGLHKLQKKYPEWKFLSHRKFFGL